MNYRADVDNEINRKEKSRFFRGHRQKSKNPLAYCEDCGNPIFGRDQTGEPYRLCYKCAGYR